jgi:hypothetical protein
MNFLVYYRINQIVGRVQQVLPHLIGPYLNLLAL